MRPVLQDNKISRKLWILYIAIFVICTVGIGVALYAQFDQNGNIGVPMGITSEESDQEDKYIKLTEEFDAMFNNQLENLEGNMIPVNKFKEDLDIVVTMFRYEKNEENCKINVLIPYLNIKDNSAINFNIQIKELYKEKAEMLTNQISNISIVYSVSYRAYIQNNILSLIIKSEFKEGEKSQRIGIQTFNYNLSENRPATIYEILRLKNITEEEANNKIKDRIKRIQNQNEPLIQEGLSLYERDYNSDIYKLSNSKYYLYGKDGVLYIIYPYGNDEDTSEMDIVIFE